MKRIAIFEVHDGAGILWDYVRYAAKEMADLVDELHVVVNGSLSEEGQNILKTWTPFVHERPDQGFDFGAWRWCIEKLGIRHLRKFQELVLLNDAFFGPFRPWKTIFAEMEHRSVDFWGLSMHGACVLPDGNGGQKRWPRHLQTYFLVIRSKMLRSRIFEDYWKHLPVPETRTERSQCEAAFTWHFVSHGFSYAPYVDSMNLESKEPEKNMDYAAYDAYEMAAHRHLPVVLRKALCVENQEHLRYGDGSRAGKALDFIRTQTAYDTGMIWQWLLAKHNLYDLHETLKSYRVCTEGGYLRTEERHVAVVLHLTYEELFEKYCRMVERTPSFINLIITTISEEKKELLETKYLHGSKHYVKVLVVPNRGREWSARLVACRSLVRKYEYVCFLHDKRSSQNDYPTIGRSFADLLADNLLASAGYVQQMLQALSDDSRLGLLVPPNVYGGNYFYVFSNPWTECYDAVSHLLDKLDLHPPLQHDKPVISIGSDFWCRYDAVAPLFERDWSYEDFLPEPLPIDGALNHALERVVPYVAQSQGYYAQTVMTAQTAATEVGDFRYMMGETMRLLSQMPHMDYGIFANFLQSLSGVVEKEKQSNRCNSHVAVPAELFSMRHRRVVLYVRDVNAAKRSRIRSLIQKYQWKDVLLSGDESCAGQMVDGSIVCRMDALPELAEKPWIVLLEEDEAASRRLRAMGYAEGLDFVDGSGF